MHVALPLALLVNAQRYGIGHLLATLAIAWVASIAMLGRPDGLLFVACCALLNALLAILHEYLADRAERLAR